MRVREEKRDECRSIGVESLRLRVVPIFWDVFFNSFLFHRVSL